MRKFERSLRESQWCDDKSGVVFAELEQRFGDYVSTKFLIMKEDVMDQIEFTEQVVRLPKESQDVRVLLVELIKDIKEKKPIAQIASENLENLMKAVEGFEKIPNEVKDESFYDLSALMASDIAKVLSGKA